MPGQGYSPNDADPFAGKALESLLSFWAEAGIDTAFEETSVDRLAERARPLPTPAAASSPSPAVVVSSAHDMSSAIAQARRLAGEASTLEALAAAIATFDGCGLKFEGARQSVFARGAPNAPIMVIGEGPGADEDVQGAPFVGRAGKLLDKMLGSAGLEGRVFITNTVFWRPPGNRTPTPEEQMICAPFLERAIGLVSPKLLLLAGGAAAKSVLQRTEGILSLRGRWFDWRSADGAMDLPAMPTLHPAFLLRQPGAKKRAWTDLLTLAERLDRPDQPA